MPAVATLADLIEVLDAEVLEVPRGLAIPVGRVVVLDEADFAGDGAGLPGDAIVLLVDTAPDIIRRLAQNALSEQMFSVLIVRGELSPTMHDFALGAEAAVLRVTEQTSWNEVMRRAERISPDAAVKSHGVLAGSTHGLPPGSLDLFGIADAAASIAGGPVTVEDSLHRILAYSADQSDTDHVRIQTLLHRRTPADVLERLRRDGTLRTVLASHEPTLLQHISPDAAARLVVPIRSDHEVLGLLWAALPTNSAPPGPDVYAGFMRCADRAATHLVQLGGVLGRVQRIEVEHLARLLHSGDEADYAGQSHVLADGIHWVVAAAFDLTPDRRTHAKSRVVHLLDRAKLTGDVQLIVGDLNDLLYVIVSMPAADAVVVDRVVGLFAEVPGICIGLSAPAAGCGQLPQARLQAERALSVARHGHPNQPIARFEEVWPTAALLRLAASPLATEIVRNGPALQLVALDHDNGTDYAKTLREYLLTGDSRAAAARLNVHVNTVRYRIAKLREEVAIDIEDPLARLVMTLQLTLIQLQQDR
jgi:DNA-binding PucR family transcriptional regulator